MEMTKKIINNIYLKKIDFKNNKDLSELYLIVKQFHESFLKSLYPCEIYNYLNYFLSEESIKDKIVFDNINYYLIHLKDKPAGFFNFKFCDDCLYLSEIFVSDENRRNAIGKYVLNFLVQKAKEENKNIIKTSIYKQNESAKLFFKKFGFSEINTQAKYLGSDIYIFEDNFEFLLN